VLNEDNHSGGIGANFIVVLHSQSEKVKPVVQAIMISTNGQQGIAFTTDGISKK
jgi:hypothetical protein